MTPRISTLLALATVALAPAAGAACAQGEPPAPPAAHPSKAGSCLYLDQVRGQSMVDDHTVLFRVGATEVWRLDFPQRCPELTSPGAFLILKPFGGMGLVCHAIDLDVKVSQAPPAGFAVPCIPGELHRLTPEELAATPKRQLP